MLHHGEYGLQGNVYSKLFKFCRENKLEPQCPIIEHYLKGPGIIFKGNPKNYITECIVPVKDIR